MASESIVLKQLGFDSIVDILPGQAVFCQKGAAAPTFCQVVKPNAYTPDSFEFVYVARLESCIDGISVYRSRQKMGEKLAKKIRQVLGDKEVAAIDAGKFPLMRMKVFAGLGTANRLLFSHPSPRGELYYCKDTCFHRVLTLHQQTSNVAAASLAAALGKPYVTALVKNQYVHRTFIMPDQALRQKSVRRKLSLIESEFRGKNVIIVDDSIVRGTTSRQIVQMAREAGALRVVVVSSSPACTHPHIVSAVVHSGHRVRMSLMILCSMV